MLDVNCAWTLLEAETHAEELKEIRSEADITWTRADVCF
jgi:hypothetical protein